MLFCRTCLVSNLILTDYIISAMLPKDLCDSLLHKLKRNEIIAELTRYSLVKYDYEYGALSMQRLLQEVIREHLSRSTAFYGWAQAMCDLIASTIMNKVALSFDLDSYVAKIVKMQGAEDNLLYRELLYAYMWGLSMQRRAAENGKNVMRFLYDCEVDVNYIMHGLSHLHAVQSYLDGLLLYASKGKNPVEGRFYEKACRACLLLSALSIGQPFCENYLDLSWNHLLKSGEYDIMSVFVIVHMYVNDYVYRECVSRFGSVPIACDILKDEVENGYLLCTIEAATIDGGSIKETLATRLEREKPPRIIPWRR